MSAPRALGIVGVLIVVGGCPQQPAPPSQTVEAGPSKTQQALDRAEAERLARVALELRKQNIAKEQLRYAMLREQGGEEQVARDVARWSQELSDPDRKVRLEAARRLKVLGRLAEAALPALEKAKSDSDPEVRRAVALALEMVKR